MNSFFSKTVPDISFSSLQFLCLVSILEIKIVASYLNILSVKSSSYL